MPAPLKILIAPLDWGLGHTTRCLPIIRYLQFLGHQVIAAAEGASAQLLIENFPALTVLPLSGYRIQYSKRKSMFTLKLLGQIPKILKAIKREHQWLQEQQAIHKFDAIISDNRYGLYHTRVKSVILTHQLQIQSGSGAFADYILRKLHYKLLERFHQCWVVDVAGDNNLSGKLAHPQALPHNAKYIGLLSQFDAHTKIDLSSSIDPYNILMLLSGPEPMRGQLETMLLQQVQELPDMKFTLVAGNPLGTAKSVPDNVVYHTHLNAQSLAEALQQASLVICRSGYSTLMDLVVMRKRALLIPTPGQTEQEYLAQYLADKKYFTVKQQHQLSLSKDLPMALSQSYKEIPLDKSAMELAVHNLLQQLV